LTAAWHHVWDRRARRDIPPYLRVHAHLCVRMGEYATQEAGRVAQVIYETRRMMYTAECTQREVRVVLLQPRIECVTVWNNLHNTSASEGAMSSWYMVVHDIIPTHFRLN